MWREVDAVALPVSECDAVVRDTCDLVESGEYDSNLEEKPKSIPYAKALRTFGAQSPRETASRFPTPPQLLKMNGMPPPMTAYNRSACALVD